MKTELVLGAGALLMWGVVYLSFRIEQSVSKTHWEVEPLWGSK